MRSTSRVSSSDRLLSGSDHYPHPPGANEPGPSLYPWEREFRLSDYRFVTSIGASLSAPSAVVSEAGQLPGEAIGGSGLWTGAVLLPPMLLVGSFWRWLLQGGAALAIGAVAVYLAWSSAIDFNWWA